MVEVQTRRRGSHEGPITYRHPIYHKLFVTSDSLNVIEVIDTPAQQSKQSSMKYIVVHAMLCEDGCQPQAPVAHRTECAASETRLIFAAMF